MCLICIEYNKNKLTLDEAWRNLHEMYEVIGEDHTWEVIDKLWEEERKLASKEINGNGTPQSTHLWRGNKADRKAISRRYSKCSTWER